MLQYKAELSRVYPFCIILHESTRHRADAFRALWCRHLPSNALLALQALGYGRNVGRSSSILVQAP